MRRPPLLPVIALGALAASVTILAAWAVDARARDGRVLPNVIMGGTDLRGMSSADVRTHVAELASRITDSRVEVSTPEGSFEATTDELGMTVDTEETLRRVMAAGRRGAAPRRLWDWLTSFIAPIRIRLTVDVDRFAVTAVLTERDPSRTPPVEPFLILDDEGRLAGADGTPGRGADPEALVRALAGARPANGAISIDSRTAAIDPLFTRDEADRLAAVAERLAAGLVSIKAGDDVATVPARLVRLWVHAVPSSGGLRLGIKPSADITGDAARLLPDAGEPATDAGFTVSGGQVQIVPGKPGTRCCGPEAAARLDMAMAGADGTRAVGPVELPLRDSPPQRDEAAARALGIVEVIGTFTTNHAGGEPRVANIHRMADMIRGTVVPPGGLFSINGIVGERTTAKGYVPAPIIDGEQRFSTDVGGGVSQFATTAFNAAFFAGLDITEYFMHGLYISRYPYAREATLSFPGPDLKFRNTTPHGVLVWTSYTNTSITVTLYSTRFAVGTQTGQTVESREPTFVPPELAERHAEEPLTCARVATERTRRYAADERTVVDYFYALYSPIEGVRCR